MLTKCAFMLVLLTLPANLYAAVEWQIHVNGQVAEPLEAAGNHYQIDSNDSLGLSFDGTLDYYNIFVWLDMNKYDYDFSLLEYPQYSGAYYRPWHVQFTTLQSGSYSGLVFDKLRFLPISAFPETGMLTIRGPLDTDPIIATVDIVPVPEPLCIMLMAAGGLAAHRKIRPR